MSSLLGIHSLSKSYGSQILFNDVSFTVSQGDRIGLLGPNGSGKSTLLKIIMELEHSDKGSISRKQALRIGYASQVPEFPSESLEEILIKEVPNGDEVEILTRARIILGKAQFTDFTANASTLSGGWKKRFDICRAMMNEPELLFLDEPTNHLDLEGILWLEKWLMREKFAYVIISHDRYFLENIANKIIELNKCYPQGILIGNGNMSSFNDHKEAFLSAQSQLERGLSSSVRQEIDWLRRSPKARTTKSRSRVDKAYELIDELSEIKKRNKKHTVDIEFSASERETRKLLVTKNLSKSINNKTLFTGIDLVLSPGSRLGIMGQNGSGKTTFLKILAGQLSPDAGTVKYSDDLKIVYFDQHREHIPPQTSLRRALSPTNDMVNYRGQSIHVNGWAKKFLFSPDRLELPISCLSGGERARILIAKLMLEPADLLFLDEPTNDLDIATLEVIEESLKDFPGAVVLISHDRCLVDRVCNQILCLGLGNDQKFYADYSQWEEAQRQPQAKKQSSSKPITEVKSIPIAKKLSYNDQRELEGMEQNILLLENEIEKFENELKKPEVQLDQQMSLNLYKLLAEVQKKLELLFDRWQFLLNKTK